MIRLSDIASVRRGYADLPQPMFRVGGEPAIGLGIAMRDGGDVLALGDNIDAALARIQADLPIGIEPHLVANQPVTVELAIGEFMESLWQAVAIILGMSFLKAQGMRPGLVVALAIPLTLAIVFAIMLVFGIDMQRISLGALINALALMVDDAMTTTDATLTSSPPATTSRPPRCTRSRPTRSPCRGYLGHDRGLRPDRLRAELRPASTASRCSPSSP